MAQDFLGKFGRGEEFNFPCSGFSSGYEIESLRRNGEQLVATFCYTPIGERTGRCRVEFNSSEVLIDNSDDMRYLSHHNNPELVLLNVLLAELSPK